MARGGRKPKIDISSLGGVSEDKMRRLIDSLTKSTENIGEKIIKATEKFVQAQDKILSQGGLFQRQHTKVTEGEKQLSLAGSYLAQLISSNQPLGTPVAESVIKMWDVIAESAKAKLITGELVEREIIGTKPVNQAIQDIAERVMDIVEAIKINEVIEKHLAAIEQYDAAQKKIMEEFVNQEEELKRKFSPTEMEDMFAVYIKGPMEMLGKHIGTAGTSFGGLVNRVSSVISTIEDIRSKAYKYESGELQRQKAESQSEYEQNRQKMIENLQESIEQHSEYYKQLRQHYKNPSQNPSPNPPQTQVNTPPPPKGPSPPGPPGPPKPPTPPGPPGGAGAAGAAGAGGARAAASGAMASSAAAVAGPIAALLLLIEVVKGLSKTVEQLSQSAAQLASATASFNPTAFVDAYTSHIDGIARAVAGEFGESMTKIFTEPVRAFMRLGDSIIAAAEKMSSYSPDVAVAMANRDVQRTLQEIRRAQHLGPKMADFVESRTQLEEQLKITMTTLLAKILPFITNVTEKLSLAVSILNSMLPWYLRQDDMDSDITGILVPPENLSAQATLSEARTAQSSRIQPPAPSL